MGQHEKPVKHEICFIQNRLMDIIQYKEQYKARIVAVVALTEIGDEAAFNALKVQLAQEWRQTVKTVIKGAIFLMVKMRYYPNIFFDRAR